MKPAVLALFLTASVLSLAACNREPDRASSKTVVEKDGVKAVVEIKNAWCRPTPNGAQAGACYLDIKSSVDNRITGVATPLAAESAIHDMVMADNIMTMSEMDEGLPLEAGKSVQLAPGGKHLMLMGLTAPLAAGTAIPLTLTFSATPAMTVQATVRQPE
jgi:copper(I)-binding protein